MPQRKRWNSATRKHVLAPDVDAFLNDIEALCIKHRMSLGRDREGFEVYRGFIPTAMTWVKDASIGVWGQRSEPRGVEDG